MLGGLAQIIQDRLDRIRRHVAQPADAGAVDLEHMELFALLVVGDENVEGGDAEERLLRGVTQAHGGACLKRADQVAVLPFAEGPVVGQFMPEHRRDGDERVDRDVQGIFAHESLLRNKEVSKTRALSILARQQKKADPSSGSALFWTR